MARKPVNQLSPLETRAAIWAAIRGCNGLPFTARDIQRETRCKTDQVGEYLRGLTAAGIVRRSGETGGRGFIKAAHVYHLVDDRGPVAPRVRRDGSAVTQGTGRLHMWRAMRVLGRFSALDLAIHATTETHQVKESEAESYCRLLAQAGYLRKNGTHYQAVRSRYSGPAAPMIQRTKQVFDPNLNKVVWSQTQGGTRDAD